MARNRLAIFFLFAFQSLYSQQSHWDVYMAHWDEGPGSVIVNMDLIKIAPVPSMPYVVITGLTFPQCRPDGLPEKEAFHLLYAVSDSVHSLISRKVKNEKAGTFTHQCERLDYVYVQDTMGVRASLVQLYQKRFGAAAFYISIKKDEEWKAYREFLYPNEETLEYMSNEKVILRLIEAGDDLSKPRQVDHWLYFKNVEDRGDFMREAKKEGYKIQNATALKERENHFQLRISRNDKVDPASINSLTMALRAKAKKYRAEYDGWETFVMK